VLAAEAARIELGQTFHHGPHERLLRCRGLVRVVGGGGVQIQPRGMPDLRGVWGTRHEGLGGPMIWSGRLIGGWFSSMMCLILLVLIPESPREATFRKSFKQIGCAFTGLTVFRKRRLGHCDLPVIRVRSYQFSYLEKVNDSTIWYDVQTSFQLKKMSENPSEARTPALFILSIYLNFLNWVHLI